MEDLYYRFKSVSVVQFATLGDNLSDNTPMDYETQFSFSYSKDECVLVSRCEVVLMQEDELKMKTIFDCFFEIKKESIDNITRNNKIVFPRSALIQLSSLNYGTLRGIIIERTKGTVFSSIFLPPLVIGEVITEDLIIPVDSE